MIKLPVPRLSLLAALLLSACTGVEGAGISPDEVGSIQLELTMLPGDAACVQVTVKGGSSSASRTVDVGPRGRSVVSLDGLPTGSVSVSGSAFAAACADIGTSQATWTADPITATLTSASATTVTLTFHRGGRIRLNADFPADVPFVKQVAVGLRHTCAILRDGTLRCWGSNDSGQLGDGTTTDQSRPIVISREKYIQVGAGAADYTCGLLAEGIVRCWGSNLFGNLGDGTFTDRPFPTEVGGLGGVKQLAVGGQHACALIDDGTVRCWGRNDFGELGIGTFGNNSPVPVSVPGLSRVVQLAAGSGKTFAVTEDGLVHSWGADVLGDGTAGPRPSPAPIPGLTNVAQAVAGDGHACARIGDGTVKCWGFNFNGEVGDGTTTARTRPVAVTGLTSVTHLGSLRHAMLAARADGSARGWGSNGSAELGDGTLIDRPTPVAVSGLTTVDQVAAGGPGNHGCAIIADGGLRCWGLNNFGQLGVGDTALRLTPVTPLF